MKNVLRKIWLKIRNVKACIKKKIWGQSWLETIPAIKDAVGPYSGPCLAHVALYTDVNAGDVLLPRSLRDVFEDTVGSLRWEGVHVRQPVTDDIVERINRTNGVVIGGGGVIP